MDAQDIDNTSFFSQYSGSDNNTLRWQLDPKEVIQEIINQLRGLEDKNGQLLRFMHALMSEEGIGYIKVILRNHLHASNALTDITLNDAYRLTLDIADMTNDLLYLCDDLWGIKNENKRLINTTVENAVFLFLKRPVDGKERDRIERTLAMRDALLKRPVVRGMFGATQSQEEEGVYQ